MPDDVSTDHVIPHHATTDHAIPHNAGTDHASTGDVPQSHTAHRRWADGPIPAELGRTALQPPAPPRRSEGMPATLLPLSSAQVEMITPKGRTGLWRALARTVRSPDELPAVDVSEIRRARSMFDYDPGKAQPLI